MSETCAMSRRHVIIGDPLGLHLRPAARFLSLAKSFRSDIVVIYKGRRVDGRSLLDLSTLAAECGTTIEIEAHGPDAEAAVTALAGLILAGPGSSEDRATSTA